MIVNPIIPLLLYTTNLDYQYLTENYMPKIEIVDVDHYNTRKLTLMYYKNEDKVLSKDATRVMKYVEELWGFPVELVDQDSKPYSI